MRTSIYFDDNYDADGIDELLDNFNEAELWYDERVIRFNGSEERLQELLRALKNVSEPKYIKP